MTAEKNKKRSKKENEDIGYMIVGAIILSSLIIFPEIIALIFLSGALATSCRVDRYAAWGKIARESTGPRP